MNLPCSNLSFCSRPLPQFRFEYFSAFPPSLGEYPIFIPNLTCPNYSSFYTYFLVYFILVKSNSKLPVAQVKNLQSPLTFIFLSHPISYLPVNCVGSAFKIYLKPNLFLLYAPWTKHHHLSPGLYFPSYPCSSRPILNSIATIIIFNHKLYHIIPLLKTLHSPFSLQNKRQNYTVAYSFLQSLAPVTSLSHLLTLYSFTMFQPH